MCVFVSSDYGVTWRSDGARGGLSFDTIATSGDGTLVLAGAYDNGYTLPRSGHFPPVGSSHAAVTWNYVAFSASGQCVAAAVCLGGGVWVSANLE